MEFRSRLCNFSASFEMRLMLHVSFQGGFCGNEQIVCIV